MPAIPCGKPFEASFRIQAVRNCRLTVELDVTEFGADEHGRYAIADGWLWVDGRCIYQVTGLGTRLVPAP